MNYKKLVKKRKKLEGKLRRVNEQIVEVQKDCSHTFEDESGTHSAWKDVGHNSHNEYRECLICGKFESK